LTKPLQSGFICFSRYKSSCALIDAEYGIGVQLNKVGKASEIIGILNDIQKRASMSFMFTGNMPDYLMI